MDVLVVGLDAASQANLTPLFEEGCIPHIETVFQDGASGNLTSQIPPWTASAWPSLYTGTNPGKHGVFGFLSFEGYDWQVVNASLVREPTLWEILDEAGLVSVVVNAPVTWPPPEIDGAIVPGYTAPEDPECHPVGVLADLRSELDEYRVYAPSEGTTRAGEKALVSEFMELTRMRGDAFRYLADRFDPDFGFVQFQHTDTVFHELPDSPAAIRTVYETVDDEIGMILDATAPETVLIVSDHGIGKCTVQFRINEFLRENGFVHGTSEGSGMPTWSTIRDQSLQIGEHRHTTDRSWSEITLNLLARAGVTTQRMGTLLDRLGITDIAQTIVPTGMIRAASEQVDFAASRAYARSRVECGVRINLAGREPNGVVPAEDYEAVRDELISLLRDVHTPDGNPVFEDVAPSEDYFTGPETHRAVDVVTVPRDFEPYVTTWLLGEQFARGDDHWDHNRAGVFAVSGAAIDADADLSTAHLFDVAPTVLSILGVPLGDRMDGDVLPVTESMGERAYERSIDEEAVTDDPEVRAQLEKLGYIE